MTDQPPPTALVLDAMGVIYSVGDDVADLLCPFIVERGGEQNHSRINSLYHDASLGRLSAPGFWRAVGLDPAVEDDYLLLHRLSPGVLDFLRSPLAKVSGIWLLSNDLSEWSQKLRSQFDLAPFFCDFVVSGEVGARKPDPAIFLSLLSKIGKAPGNCLLVDDREANLDAARLLGMRTILFNPSRLTQPSRHRTVANFSELRSLLDGS